MHLNLYRSENFELPPSLKFDSKDVKLPSPFPRRIAKLVEDTLHPPFIFENTEFRLTLKKVANNDFFIKKNEKKQKIKFQNKDALKKKDESSS